MVTLTQGSGRDQAPVSMNKYEKFLGFRGEARVRYLDGEFQVLSQGDFVRCAVTGSVIPLNELKYWSVALQEPYANAAASLKRHLEQKQRQR
jgi:hypothetical protein